MADTGMEIVDEEMSSPDSPCRFLLVPKEIRLEIYRYLLLPDVEIDFLSRHPRLIVEESDDESIHSDGTSDQEVSEMFGGVDDWTDESDSGSDDSIDTTMSEMVEREFNHSFGDDRSLSSPSSDEFDEDDYKRHLAILRTNRQIHSEAISIFYSEAVMVLEPGDIFCLAKRPLSAFFGSPNPCSWKHSPLLGCGMKDKTGMVTYDTPQLQGDIEPHIFARFQKILFVGLFDEEHTREIELWIDDRTHVIKPEDAEAFKKMLRSTSMFKDLAKIIRQSPRINSLEFTLAVEVVAMSELILGDDMGDIDQDDMDEDKDSDDEDEVDIIMDIANQKATEIFLDSDVMYPITKLKNVSTFDIKFDLNHVDPAKSYKPPEKYVNKLREMKMTIEGNFKDMEAAE